MAVGRCAGCGRVDSLRKINHHAVDCQPYIELFAQVGGTCPDPVTEYLRWREEGGTPQARAEQRDERLRTRFAEINRQQVASAHRWTRPPDILD